MSYMDRILEMVGRQVVERARVRLCPKCLNGTLQGQCTLGFWPLTTHGNDCLEYGEAPV